MQLAVGRLQELRARLRRHGRMVIPELDRAVAAVHDVEAQQRVLGEGDLPQRLLLAGQIDLQFQQRVVRLLAGRA